MRNLIRAVSLILVLAMVIGLAPGRSTEAPISKMKVAVLLRTQSVCRVSIVDVSTPREWIFVSGGYKIIPLPDNQLVTITLRIVKPRGIGINLEPQSYFLNNGMYVALTTDQDQGQGSNDIASKPPFNPLNIEPCVYTVDINFCVSEGYDHLTLEVFDLDVALPIPPPPPPPAPKPPA